MYRQEIEVNNEFLKLWIFTMEKQINKFERNWILDKKRDRLEIEINNELLKLLQFE